jgi:hypothetical protein
VRSDQMDAGDRVSAYPCAGNGYDGPAWVCCRTEKRTWNCCLHTCILLKLPSSADGSPIASLSSFEFKSLLMTGDITPPPFVITENDKRGLIVVTAAITLAFVWTCFFVRVWLRLQVREWRSDDYFLAAATVRLKLSMHSCNADANIIA